MQYPEHFGTYKATVIDSVMDKTTTGLPQLVQKFHVTEYYDVKEDEWYDVSDNGWFITGYFCLYYRKDGEPEVTLNHTQVVNVYKWDGAGFAFLLDDQNFVGQTVQIRVVEDTYEKSKAPVKVNWLDTEDADPNPSLRGIDEDDAKDLEAEFAAAFSPKSKKKP